MFPVLEIPLSRWLHLTACSSTPSRGLLCGLQHGGQCRPERVRGFAPQMGHGHDAAPVLPHSEQVAHPDRKSTRLNSSHVANSYAVFCLKKKNHEAGQRAARCDLTLVSRNTG